jgi:hypothetical protein
MTSTSDSSIVRRLSAFVGIALACFTLPAHAQTTLTGFARIVDADTIAIGTDTIRLQGNTEDCAAT